jgi:DNA polymerase elongation subunit (family B)
MKLAFISKLSPSWNQTYDYTEETAQETGTTIIKYFVGRCGPDIIVTDVDDLIQKNPLPKEFKESIPIDLGYYVDDQLIGYLDTILVKFGAIYFVFTPTDDIKDEVKKQLGRE